ncbi:MAG: LON peptidase substrate-binding domain-containing protein [Parvularculaceae bacterium]|nr:LON peptidase substrate-binding domain-containing protein [Parvularculaceae bacterium]
MTTREKFLRLREFPEALPLFPLSGALLLPGGQLPLNIFEPRYLRMIDDALGEHRLIGMIQPKDSGARAEKGLPSLFQIGCAGRITAFSETGDGRYLITLTGFRRFEIERELPVDTPYRQALVDWSRFARDDQDDPSGALVDRDRLEGAMRQYLAAEGLKTDWKAVGQAPVDALVASLAMGCPFAPSEKQALLEAATLGDRASCLIALMEMSRPADPGGAPPMQ